MEDEFTPPTQPEGALVPPPKAPPTAIAAADIPLPPSRRVAIRSRELTLGGLVTGLLDGLDILGDRIATGLGLRA